MSVGSVPSVDPHHRRRRVSPVIVSRTRRDWLALIAAVIVGTAVPWLFAATLRGHGGWVPASVWLILLVLGIALFAYARWPRMSEHERRRAYDERKLKRHLIAMAAIFYLLLLATIGLILVFASTQARTFVHLAALAVIALLVLFAYGRYVARRLKVSWTRPRALRLTGFGWLYGAFAVSLGVVALQGGHNLLIIVFGILASYALVSAALSSNNFRRLKVEREFPEVLVAGRLVTVRARLRNEKRLLASYSLWLEEGWPLTLPLPEAGAPSAYALAIAPRGEAHVRYPLLLPDRGRVHFPGFTLASRFPFGLFTRYRYVRKAQSVLVWPAPVPIPPALRMQAPDTLAAPLMQVRHSRGHAEVCGVRDYVAGADDVRSIHWPSSARHARPIVRERERETAAPRLIVLERGRAGSKAFERQIGLAAELIDEALAASTPVSLAVAPAEPLAPLSGHHAQRRRLLDALAELQGYASEAEQQQDQQRMHAATTKRPWPIPAGTWVIALHCESTPAFLQWLSARVPATLTLSHHRRRGA